MKTLARLASISLFLIVGLPAQAQQELDVLPTEIFACNFVGTSDISDLNDAFDDFNAWADANGINDLTMYLLTPNFYSEDFEYDLIGMNIWPTGAAFGSGNAEITADPSAVAGFDGVVDCAAHSMYALVGVKPPAEDPQTGGLFEFTNCTVQGNRSDDEGIGAVAAVSELFGQWNLNDAHGALFNIWGETADAAYDFKWITYYPSYETFGSLFDHIVNEGHIETLGAIIDPVMQCDSSRVYVASVMREAATE